MSSNSTAVGVVNSFYDKESKVWHGAVAEPRYGPQDSIGSIALAGMRKYPEHIVQICYQSGRQMTNREMGRLAIQAALHFQKLNLEQSDMIGMCVVNSDYVAPLFFGAIFNGLCISTSDPSFNNVGLKHVYSMSRPKVMFCDGENYRKVRQAFNESGLSSTTIYTVRNHIEGVPNILVFFEGTADEDEFIVPPLKNGSDQVAMIICTSGSTGLPKGVCLPHSALLNIPVLSSNFEPRVLCFNSIYWTFAVTILILSGTERLTRIISETPFTPQDFFDIVKHYKVNVAAGAPSHIPLCLASDKLTGSDLSSLRVMFTNGKTVPYSVFEKFKPFAPNCIFNILYGLTETCASIAATVSNRTNSVGRLLVNTEVKLLNDHGELLGPNETGEVFVRTRFPGSGYLNNPEATKAMYGEDGWVRTGDMGYFNDEGQFYIVDRRKDILKYNNFHFAPTNIEKIISEIPAVAEVCVVGIPDSTYDFLPAAAVVKRYGAELEESDISQHVTDRMQHFENLVGGVYFFNNLPETVSGKVLRSEVAEMCKNRRNEEGSVWP